ncbi:hypothetical protein ACPA9J_00700 [Pseudomonas aeruginosa]
MHIEGEVDPHTGWIRDLRGNQGDLQADLRATRPQLSERYSRPRKPHQRKPPYRWIWHCSSRCCRNSLRSASTKLAPAVAITGRFDSPDSPALRHLL